MKLNLLKAGLQQLLKDSNEQTEQIQEAIAEITELQGYLANDQYVDSYDGDCFVLHASDASILIVDATYDTYGRLVDENGRQQSAVTFDMYEAAIRNLDSYDYLPRSLLEVGYDVVASVYEDNELNGCHHHHNDDDDI